MRDEPNIGGLSALFLIGAAVREGAAVAYVLLPSLLPPPPPPLLLVLLLLALL